MPTKPKKNKVTKKTVKKQTEDNEAISTVVVPETPTPPTPSPEPLQVVQPASPSSVQNSGVVSQPQEVSASSPVVPPAETNSVPEPISKDQGEPPSSDSTPPSDSSSDSKGKKNLLLSMVFIVLLGIAILGGVFLYRQISGKSEEASKAPIAEEKIEVTPEPTKKELDLSQYSIKILNGSGVAGEAGKQQESLEAEGFTVSSVGNAEVSDYDETIIQAKKSVDKEFLDKLKEALEESFAVGKIEVLDEDEEEDVVVIIGSKTSE